jgi:hypothetical protein
VLVNDDPWALNAIRSSTVEGAACKATIGASNDATAAAIVRLPLFATALLIAVGSEWS